MSKQISTLFILLITTICIGQIRGEKEFQECEIILKDSTSFEGFCRIIKRDKIQFTIERDSTPDIWDSRDVQSVRFFRSNFDEVLEYIKVHKKRKPRLLEIKIHGDVMLYADTSKRLVKDKEIPGINGSRWTYKIKEVIMGYYIRRKNSGELLAIKTSWSNRTWKKKMISFFHDCPLLVEDLEGDAYDKKSFRQLVEDYNVYCVE